MVTRLKRDTARNIGTSGNHTWWYEAHCMGPYAAVPWEQRSSRVDDQSADHEAYLRANAPGAERPAPPPNELTWGSKGIPLLARRADRIRDP